MTSSLEVSDAAAAAVAVAPRVQLADIEAAIANVFYLDTEDAVRDCYRIDESNEASLKAIACLTICLVVLKNGFTVIGKSAPASPENFNAELGRKFAYEDAIRQIWPLMGFELRARLYKDQHGIA